MRPRLFSLEVNGPCFGGLVPLKIEDSWVLGIIILHYVYIYIYIILSGQIIIFHQPGKT